MDDGDRRLLTLIQEDFPLRSKPFEWLGKRLGMDEAEVLLRVHRLKSSGILEEIRAIFDIRDLGYQSTLVAMHVPAERFRRAVSRVSAHPGVSFCCQRMHRLNIWLTLSVPPAQSLAVHVDNLHKAAEASESLVLPALSTYKRGFKMDPMDTEYVLNQKRYGRWASKDEEHHDLNSLELEVIRLLQHDLPINDQPYRKIAKTIDLSEAQLFEIVHSFIARGYWRRCVGFIKRKNHNPSQHALSVWNIPEEKIEEVGRKMAPMAEVHYCCYRPPYQSFPFSFYASVKASSREEAEAVERQIESVIGKWPYEILLCQRIFKKSRLKYFIQELNDWSEANADISGLFSSAIAGELKENYIDAEN